MSKAALSEQEIMKNLSDLKDLREVIQNIVKSGELIEKAQPFSVPEPKPKTEGPATGGLEYLGRKVHPSLGRIHYMYGIKGHKTHYVAEYDMKSAKNPWSVSLKSSNDGSTLGRSPNAHASKEDAAGDIAHHHSLGQWKK